MAQQMLIDSFSYNLSSHLPFRLRYELGNETKKVEIKNLVWNNQVTTDIVKNIGATLCKYDSNWVMSGEGPAICSKCASDFGTTSFQQAECKNYM